MWLILEIWRYFHFSVTNLKEQECREALLAFVGEHCCYGKGCAEDMNILKIQPSTALHVSLGTSINWPNLQIPPCTSSISINALFCNRNVHVCTFLLQTGALWDICWCIVGLLRLVYCTNSYFTLTLTQCPQEDVANFECVIFEFIWWIDIMSACKIVIRYIPQNSIDGKSMVWCRQAASHYLSQCWPRFSFIHVISFYSHLLTCVVTNRSLLCKVNWT